MIPRILNPNSKPSLKKHVVNKLVEIAPQHLFSVVTDVNSYKYFLPFCKASQILRRSDCGTMFDASLKIGVSDMPPLNSIEEEYVSRVKYFQQLSSSGKREWIVEAKSIKSNLFQGLNSSWKLSDVTAMQSPHHGNVTNSFDTNGTVEDKLTEAAPLTNVKFEVEMSVTDPIIAVALDQVLESVALQQIEAFEKRCRDIPFHQ
jgi:coenzyme Q-binding protein COQ10